MTLAELIRAIDSKKRAIRAQEIERANFDYVLADLIGASVARIYSSKSKFPSITEVYSFLFDTEEIKEKQQEKIDELSVARFKQFAQSYNKKIKKEVSMNSERET